MTNSRPLGTFTLWILLLAFLGNGLAWSYFAALIPALGRELGFSDARTGVLLSTAALLITVVAPFWGRVCERRGRRGVLVTGVLATLVFAAGTAAVVGFRLAGALSVESAFVLLLLVRLANAFFTGGLKPAGQASIADLTPPGGRARGMGLMGAAFGLGTILSAGVVILAGTRSALAGFLAITALLAPIAALVLRALPESRPASSAGNTVSALRYGPLWPALAITLLGMTLFSLLQQVTALRLEDQHGLARDAAARSAGAAMMLMMGTMVIVQGVVLQVLALAPRTLVRGGNLVALAALLLALAAASPLQLVGTMALFGIALGLLVPGNLALLSFSAGAQAQGRVSGINGVSQGLGLAAGPLLGASLHGLSPLAPYGAGCMLAVVIVLLALRASNDSMPVPDAAPVIRNR